MKTTSLEELTNNLTTSIRQVDTGNNKERTKQKEKFCMSIREMVKQRKALSRKNL